MNWLNLLHKLRDTPLIRDQCDVKGCEERDDLHRVTIKAFDPIDHDDHSAKLCTEHRTWVRQRNEFAEEMYEPLRQARRRVGMKHIDRVQEWVVPQGTMREDVLDGSIKNDPDGKQALTLEDALE